MAISMLKIRRPLGRLIFNMGIAIPGKTVFLIETPPWVGLCHWGCLVEHYSDVIMGAMASQITSVSIIKAPRHWPLGGDFTGER